MDLRASDKLEPVDKATVHGIVTRLSPVKDSKRSEKKYFECRLVDDKSVAQAVCFHKEQHKKILEFDGKPVAFVDCKIQRKRKAYAGGNEGDVELVVEKRIKIEASKLELTDNRDTVATNPKDVKLSEVSGIAVDQRVNVKVKIVKVMAKSETKAYGKVLVFQNVLVCDESGLGRLVLWEGDVGKVAEGKSYAVNNGKVKLYEGVKYLSVTNETDVDEVDLGDVSGSSSQVLEEYSICGEIISCSKVTHYLSCGICKSRIDSFSSVDNGVWCTDCESYVLMRRCSKEVTVKVNILDFADENPREISVLALTEHVMLLSNKTQEELSEMSKMDICKAIVGKQQVVKVDFDSGIVRNLSIVS